ncbi:unnamed protein product, partial [Coregonus sp. 'balchen']
STTVAVTAGVVLLSTVGIIVALYLGKKKKPPVTLLDSTKKYQLALIDKEVLRTYPGTAWNHVYLSARIDGSLVVRPYTPVSSDDDKGYVDLVVKMIIDNGHTQQLSSILDKITLVSHRFLPFHSTGQFAVQTDKKYPAEIKVASTVGLIAGGTGITPMLQLVRAIMKDPSDRTTCSLLYANQTEKDILLRDELEEVQARHPDRFKLWFTVDRAPKGWEYSEGFINADMIQEHLPAPSDDTLVLMCGPPPMIQFACNPNLDKLGYRQSQRFAY